MKRIQKTFQNLRLQKRGGLIAFVMAGDPSLAKTPEIVAALARGGADIIELGVPFSDPAADGPVIQQAAERALAGGATLTAIIGLLREMDLYDLPPIVLMTYYNPILKYGLEKFAADAAAAGVSGLIVVDLPPEEAGDLLHGARAARLDTIFLTAPATPLERAAMIANKSRGFLYCVSRMGTTGARAELPPELISWLERLRTVTRLPLAAGFGIASAEHVREVLKAADAAVVGSLLVAECAKGGADLPERLTRLVMGLRVKA